MIGILLLSHGQMCRGILDSMEVLGCDTHAVQAIPLDTDTDIEVYTERISAAIDDLDTGDGVLVLVDLIAGTPFNRICTLYGQKNMEVLTGMNLAMCVTAASVREFEGLQEIAEELITEGREGIINIKSLFQETGE